jgi:hypothetical protein
MTQEQFRSAGVLARRLLGFALAQLNRDSGLVGSGLETVCRTYESDMAESATILRRCLKPEHVRLHGHEELDRLGREVARLVSIDPAIVEDIYRAAFTNNDESSRVTDFGGSRIMPMSSNSAQDFKMGRWVLAQQFPTFLRIAPLNALGALISAIDFYVEERRRDSERLRNSISAAWRELHDEPVEEPAEEPQLRAFNFNGHIAHIKEDGSEYWDASGVHHDDEPIKMLDASTPSLASCRDPQTILTGRLIGFS